MNMNFVTTVVEDDVSKPNVKVDIVDGMVTIEFNRFKINETIKNKNVIIAAINKKLTELRGLIKIPETLVFDKQSVGNIEETVDDTAERTLDDLVEKERKRNGMLEKQK